VKRVHQRPPEPESQLDYDNQENEEDRRPQKKLKPELRAKGKGKENAQGKRLTTEDPMQVAQLVLENAPRRQRARMIGKSQTASKVIGRPSRGRRVTRGDSRPALRSNEGSKGSRMRKKNEDESTPEDLRRRGASLPVIFLLSGSRLIKVLM
jgi:hypothetical protein